MLLTEIHMTSYEPEQTFPIKTISAIFPMEITAWMDGWMNGWIDGFMDGRVRFISRSAVKWPAGDIYGQHSVV